MRASSVCDASEILEHARGDAHAGRGERRAEEDVHVQARLGQQPGADAPAEDERGRSRRASRPTNEESPTFIICATVDSRPTSNSRMMTPSGRACRSTGSVLSVVEPGEADEREVAEQHAGRQLAEHGRLSEPDRQWPPSLAATRMRASDRISGAIGSICIQKNLTDGSGGDRTGRNGPSGKHARRLQGKIVSTRAAPAG